jgi:hypothetical protein
MVISILPRGVYKREFIRAFKESEIKERFFIEIRQKDVKEEFNI